MRLRADQNKLVAFFLPGESQTPDRFPASNHMTTLTTNKKLANLHKDTKSEGTLTMLKQ